MCLSVILRFPVKRVWLAAVLWLLGSVLAVQAQTLPMVGVHDSELTRALATMPATRQTPRGAGTTGFEWWPTQWNYFVMPESVKEMLRSDGTAHAVVSDADISAGGLLVNGMPKYPIVISLAAEAIRDDEIAQLTNYVAAGGFLFVGSSSFTRNTNGTFRGDFAIAPEMGVYMVFPAAPRTGCTNSYVYKTDRPPLNRASVVWEQKLGPCRSRPTRFPGASHRITIALPRTTFGWRRSPPTTPPRF